MTVPRASGRGSGARRTTVMVTVLTVATLLGSCTGTPEAKPVPKPRPTVATPLNRVDLSGLPVARGAFCDLLDPRGVERALGGPVLSTHHYGNGDEAKITPGLTDVSHEYNCTFEGEPPARARAWVFARPVQTKEARRLARQAASAHRCREQKSLKFGHPTVTVACTSRRPEPSITVGMHGLFGRSWLSCEVTVPRDRASTPGNQRAEAVKRTQRWCVDLVTTIGARP